MVVNFQVPQFLARQGTVSLSRIFLPLDIGHQIIKNNLQEMEVNLTMKVTSTVKHQHLF
jgi:hypothetical protein